MKLTSFLFALIAIAACRDGAESSSPRGEPENTNIAADKPENAADNTAKNARERPGMANTPGDQGENAADLSITQQIRKNVVGDDALSMNAKNVKVITADGVVTLLGPVESVREKDAIVVIAKKVDGVKRVDNQLEIAAK